MEREITDPIINDEPAECYCEDYDVDILEGRARCERCGNSWFLGTAELKANEALHLEYWETADRENQIEFGRRPIDFARRWGRKVKAWVKRPRPLSPTTDGLDDEIPF